MKVLRRISFSILMILFLTVGVTYAQSLAEESYDKGVEYAVQGEFQKAKEEFEKALQVGPSFDPAEYSLKIIKDVIEQKIKREAAIHLFKGTSYANKGEYDQAISDYTNALEINPKLTSTYNSRGFLYFVLLGNKVKGCADWKKACELGNCRNYNAAKRRGDCEERRPD